MSAIALKRQKQNKTTGTKKACKSIRTTPDTREL